MLHCDGHGVGLARRRPCSATRKAAPERCHLGTVGHGRSVDDRMTVSDRPGAGSGDRGIGHEAAEERSERREQCSASSHLCTGASSGLTARGAPSRFGRAPLRIFRASFRPTLAPSRAWRTPRYGQWPCPRRKRAHDCRCAPHLCSGAPHLNPAWPNRCTGAPNPTPTWPVPAALRPMRRIFAPDLTAGSPSISEKEPQPTATAPNQSSC